MRGLPIGKPLILLDIFHAIKKTGKESIEILLALRVLRKPSTLHPFLLLKELTDAP